LLLAIEAIETVDERHGVLCWNKGPSALRPGRPAPG
jgi:hypothetical protein